jgi:hypothetical protein
MDNVALTFLATKRVADDSALLLNDRLWRDSLGQILATAAAQSKGNAPLDLETSPAGWFMLT